MPEEHDDERGIERVPPVKHKWTYQEWYFRWSCWGIGYETTDKRGWGMDERTVYIGPVRIVLLSSSQMEAHEAQG